MSEQSKSAETKQRILQGALKLFQSKGYEATTMREVAEEAGMAVGAAYYHFRSKEEIVFAYYAATQDDADEFAKKLVANERDVKTRIDKIIRYKLEQLKPYRPFLNVLGQTASNPSNPLSPFSPETKEIRDRAVRVFEHAIEGGNLKVSKQLVKLLPKILWFYHMGIIFFWLHDQSDEQKRTNRLLKETLGILLRLLQLSALPLMKPLNQKVVSIISIIEGR